MVLAGLVPSGRSEEESIVRLLCSFCGCQQPLVLLREASLQFAGPSPVVSVCPCVSKKPSSEDIGHIR